MRDFPFSHSLNFCFFQMSCRYDWGQIEDQAVTETSITAVETSLCGHHVFASLMDGVIVTRHVMADDGEEVRKGYTTDKPSGTDREEGGGGGSRPGAGAGANGGLRGVTVRLHPHSRELRLPRAGVAITCMRLSPDGASLICGASSAGLSFGSFLPFNSSARNVKAFQACERPMIQ